MTTPDTERIRWRMVAASLNRPYPVSLSMIALVSLVPFYLFLAERAKEGTTLYVPEMPLDRALPLQPTWALVYGPLYLFLILLPVLVVRQNEQIRRTLFAYLAVWLVAYLSFVLYPTTASRPDKVIGEGFAIWGLRFLYSSDPPYNCFPSIHVAHSFVSALTCYRVHRGVGVAAVFAAGLVGLSALFTKQHYVADVIAGFFLAGLAALVFLRTCRREAIPELDRRLAPFLALVTAGIVGLGFACFWAVYRLTGGS